jgi:septal ring factor EnvC (AmiA/AmiB activator)
MADRTIEQMNIALERLEQISAENTQNMGELQRNLNELQVYVAQVAGTVERIAVATEQRLNGQDELIQALISTTDQRLNRQDQLIALLSSYITGTPPNQAEGA